MTSPIATATFLAAPGQPVSELPRAEGTSGYQFPEEWLGDLIGWAETSSGVRVSPEKGLSHASVWQAVNLIAGDLGQLPLRVVRREEGGAVVDDPTHRVDWLLNDEPNPWQTPDVFWETLLAWTLLYGNGVAVIVGPPGLAQALVPLDPRRMRCVTDDAFGYAVVWTHPVTGRETPFFPAEVVHLRGLATDGVWGRSCVDVARDVIGHGLAMREHASRFFRNGARPGGVLRHPGVMDDAARANLRREWQQFHAGAGNAHRTAVLYEGMEYQALSLSNEDAQLFEGMKLNREEVASLFNLPPFKLGALENSTVRSNLEEQQKDYYQSSLARWSNRRREECKRKLFTERERRERRLDLRTDTSPLTSGGEDARMTRAVKGVTARILTRNEARQLVGRNPVDGGDVFENPAVDTNRNRPGSDSDPAATDGSLDEREPEREPRAS